MTSNTVLLSDVCTFAIDRITALDSTQRALRIGPYPHYADNCLVSTIEDWEFERGGVIMVPALGTVLASDGRLMAYYEPERCSANRQVLPLVPRDPHDGRYIWRVLTTFKEPAACVGGTPQLREVAPAGLMHTSIPWPDADVRRRYVEALDACEARATDLVNRIPALLRKGDATFAQMLAEFPSDALSLGKAAAWQKGTDVPTALRGTDKPFGIEGAAGTMGRCDDPLCQEPCIVMGPTARKVLAHYCSAPCHPIAETVYTSQNTTDIPLPVLFFAMRAAGLPDRVREAGSELQSSARTLAQAMELPIRVGNPDGWAGVLPQLEAVLEDMQAAALERTQAVADRMEIILRYEKTGEIPADLASRYATSPQRTENPSPCTTSCDIPCECPATPLVKLAQTTLARLGIQPKDAAWELAPLAILRTNLGVSLWNALTEMARTVLHAGTDSGTADLPRFVDVALANVASSSNLLSFLDGFSYTESDLGVAGIAETILALDELDPAHLDARSLRDLFRYGSELPIGVTQEECLVDAVTSCCGQVVRDNGQVAMAYVPCDQNGMMADAAGRAGIEFAMAAQCPDIMDSLADALVRNRMGAAADTEAGTFAYSAGSSLTADAFPGVKASLVVASLPVNDGEWTDKAVDRTDPRWVLGTPPRNKANFAWLQHCMSHTLPGGMAVVLTTNAPLCSTVGCEPSLRQALLDSGRLRLVVKLPARMEGVGAAARTLLVLGDERTHEEAHHLEVDLLDQGIPASDGSGGRVLSNECLAAACELCQGWLEGETVPNSPIPHRIWRG